MAMKSSGLGFFQHLFSSLFKSNDPEAEKKRLLKSIAKDLSKTRFKFYKAGTEDILPSFGKFFYDLYKVISPAQTTFQSIDNPNYFKNIVIDQALTEEQKATVDKMSEESITTLASNIPFNQ